MLPLEFCTGSSQSQSAPLSENKREGMKWEGFCATAGTCLFSPYKCIYQADIQIQQSSAWRSACPCGAVVAVSSGSISGCRALTPSPPPSSLVTGCATGSAVSSLPEKARSSDYATGLEIAFPIILVTVTWSQRRLRSYRPCRQTLRESHWNRKSIIGQASSFL